MQTHRKHKIVQTLTPWSPIGLAVKIISTVIASSFVLGTIYSAISTKVEATESRVVTLEEKQVVDHETLTRIDQNVTDLKLYWAVPHYGEKK